MLIERILILRKEGMPLFDYEKYSKGDEILISGLLSAIMTFAEETEKQTISKLVFAESNYIFRVIGKLIFVLKISDEMQDRYAELVLERIVEAFLDMFEDVTEKFTGEIGKFTLFQEKCQVILHETGIALIEKLLDESKYGEIRAIGVFNQNNEQIQVLSHKPDYSFKHFELYRIITKNFRKIINKHFSNERFALCHMIAKNGFTVTAVALPHVSLILETELNMYSKELWLETKLMRYSDLKELVKTAFGCEEVSVYSTRLRHPITDEEANAEEKELFDFFTANNTGIKYIGKAEQIIQIISTNNRSSIIIAFPTRICFGEYSHNIGIKQIYYRLIGHSDK